MGILNHFTNLRVRTKLVLFMLVPLITIFSLISNNIYNKYSLVRNNDQIFQFVMIIAGLDELVHSLQKERGLSSGFVASEGKLYQDELSIQRQHSNERLSQLYTQFNKLDLGRSFDDIELNFRQQLLQLEQLPEIRKLVNHLDDNGFSRYSKINEAAIDMVYHFHHNLQIRYGAPALSHQTELYTLLLEFQEHAGQERALLNQAFSQQQLNLQLFQAISTTIVLQQKAVAHYLNIADILQRRQLEELLAQPFMAEVEAFRDVAFSKWQRNMLLNKLHAFIGYGGLIHDFKNYVIRGESSYYDRFNSLFIDAQKTLAQFRQISGLDEQQLTHIDVIEATFNQYLDLLDNITQMHSDGASVSAIDKEVKVDDEAALNAIAALRIDISATNPKLWWHASTTRINNFNTLSDMLLADLTQNIQQQQTIAWRDFYLYIALMILVIGITLLLGYLLVNRLAKETSQIASAMNKMHQSGQFNALTLRSGNDEIGEIISAFNALNEKRDQTEQERLHSQQQLLEAKRINALYKLSGGVAHNFNNMLATILGYASIAMTHKDVEDSEKVKDYLKRICDNVERASALVENIITYSQVDSLASVEPLQIDKAIKELIEHQQIPTSIRLTHHIEADLPPVRIEQEKLKRLFNALIINAIEAIDGEGVIEVALHTIILDKEQCHACGKPFNGRFVELSIKDSGNGIADDMIEHIFDPFFTSKDLSYGAGMGLSTVYGIVRRCGGHIHIESTMGQGSKFRVFFPLS